MYFLTKSGSWCNCASETMLRVQGSGGLFWVRAGSSSTDDTRTPDFTTEQDARDFAAKLARAAGTVE